MAMLVAAGAARNWQERDLPYRRPDNLVRSPAKFTSRSSALRFSSNIVKASS